MKIIISTSWSLVLVYGLLPTYSALTLTSSGTDAAGRGLGIACIFVGFVLLVLLTGLNSLPFRLTHIAKQFTNLITRRNGLMLTGNQCWLFARST